MFSAVTKNVRKYAEVTSARLSAMSTRASSSEIKQYLASISSICDKAQVFIVLQYIFIIVMYILFYSSYFRYLTGGTHF